MPGARGLATASDAPSAAKARPRRGGYGRARRPGKLTEPELALVAQVVQDQPAEMSTKQVNGLAAALNRSPEVIKGAVASARDRFVEQAGHYVDVHRTAVDMALLRQETEVAMKGAQWFLEKVSDGKDRIIEKPAAGPQGNQIMIGIRVGGVTAMESAEPTLITLPAAPSAPADV